MTFGGLRVGIGIYCHHADFSSNVYDDEVVYTWREGLTAHTHINALLFVRPRTPGMYIVQAQSKQCVLCSAMHIHMCVGITHAHI